MSFELENQRSAAKPGATARLADLVAERDKIDEALSDLDHRAGLLREARGKIDAEIFGIMDAQGVDVVGVPGRRVAIETVWRAKYDPAKWPDVVRWAIERGYDHIVQRRLSDRKVMELVDANVPLPDGLSVESFREVRYRKA